MTAFEIIGSILLIITCVLITIAVLLQESKKNGMDSLSGKGSAALSAEKKSTDAKLVRLTKVLAVIFFVVTIAVYAITMYL